MLKRTMFYWFLVDFCGRHNVVATRELQDGDHCSNTYVSNQIQQKTYTVFSLFIAFCHQSHLLKPSWALVEITWQHYCDFTYLWLVSKVVVICFPSHIIDCSMKPISSFFVEGASWCGCLRNKCKNEDRVVTHQTGCKLTRKTWRE